MCIFGCFRTELLLYPSSLYLKSQANTENGGGVGIPVNAATARLSAGADCMGFAMRARSYQGARYVWPALPSGDRAEGVVYPDSHGRRGIFPVGDADQSAEIIHCGMIANTTVNHYVVSAGDDDGPTIDQLNEYKEKFRRIIPGDIISYGPLSAAVAAGRASRGGAHIAIVNKVDQALLEAATSLSGLFGSIEIIESIYNGRRNSVFTRWANQGPSTDDGYTMVVKRDMNNWFLMTGEQTIRSWSIQRLRAQ